MSKLWRIAAIAFAACGLAVTTAAPAMAQPTARASVGVTIGAHSRLPVVTHDVFVTFQNKSFSAATISGAVTGATAGEVAALYARPFPYTAKPAPVSGHTVTLTGAASQKYSFKVRPSVATRYTVRVWPSSTVQSPAVDVSKTVVVYVVTTQVVTHVTSCGRPVCHQSIRVTTRLPASAYRTEVRKRWFFYFGLKLAAHAEPGPPKTLTLKAIKISKPRKVSATRFERTLSFSFRIGSHAYHWLADFCSKDTESKDGIGLPGSHHCGVKRISSRTVYLG